MKKVICAMVLVIGCATYSFAQEEKKFATTGVWELGGTVEFSGYKYFTGDPYYHDQSYIYLNFAPRFDYFLINGFHVGFAPGIELSANMTHIEDISTAVYFVPTVSLGYCFRLADRLFLNLEGSYGFGVSVYDNFWYENDADTYLYMNFGLVVGFKIPVGNALFNVGIKQNYHYQTWDQKYSDDIYQVGLVFGVSAYL
jgi:hypothetical protein